MATDEAVGGGDSSDNEIVCPVCWSSSLVSLIEKIPSSEYLAVCRKSSEWTIYDEERKRAITDAVIQAIPGSLTSTCFGTYFPQYMRTVCDPDGFNFHSRMHNDNGKCVIEYLILASLGLCKSLNPVYSNIIVCGDKYFRVHRTCDVVVMAFRTGDSMSAINWLLSDSPRTPKSIIADTESSTEVKKIRDKTHVLHAAMTACSVGGGCLLGLILSGNMMLKAYMLSEERIEEYLPLNNKDLSEIRDLIHVMKQLNAFLHSHCMEMNETLRSKLPLVRSRSSSVAPSPSSSNFTSVSQQ